MAKRNVDAPLSLSFHPFSPLSQLPSPTEHVGPFAEQVQNIKHCNLPYFSQLN